jgi:hypothetical protein
MLIACEEESYEPNFKSLQLCDGERFLPMGFTILKATVFSGFLEKKNSRRAEIV